MKNFSLQLSIDPNDLAIIQEATLKITLAKLVSFEINVSELTLTLTETPSYLAWLVFDPFQINTIQWSDQYSIYASTQSELDNKTVISKTSQTTFPADDAAYYSFNASAIFSGPYPGSGDPPSGAYKVNNYMPSTQYPALTFGLQQTASINENTIDNPSPVNAAVVPYNYPITFTPVNNIIYVWLQTPLTSGTVIAELPNNSTQVIFDNGKTQQKLQYDSSTGRFI